MGISIGQFTAGSTARDTYLQLGFVPDFVIIFEQHSSTNPNIRYWFDKGSQTLPASAQVPGVTTAPANVSQWLDANDSILHTGGSDGGSTLTRDTSSTAAYFGGDLIASDESINSNPVHPFSDGTFPKAGAITAAGIFLPAGDLTANLLYIVVAFRRDKDAKVGGGNLSS